MGNYSAKHSQTVGFRVAGVVFYESKIVQTVVERIHGIPTQILGPNTALEAMKKLRKRRVAENIKIEW